MNAWVFNYGVPDEIEVDNVGFFKSKFFIDVCKIMSIENNFTSTCHPKSNGQVKRYHHTILAELRTYVADHPRDWYLYTDVLTYAYYFQWQTSMDVAPFNLVLSTSPGPLALKLMPTPDEPQRQFKLMWKHWHHETLGQTNDRLEKAKAK